MTLDIETIWKIIGVIFGAGMIYAELQSIKKHIQRLEIKQDAYNNLQIRVVKGEVRIDNIDKELAEIKSLLKK